MLQSMGLQSRTQLSDWTRTNVEIVLFYQKWGSWDMVFLVNFKPGYWNFRNVEAKGSHHIIRTTQLCRQTLTLTGHTGSILVLNETQEKKSVRECGRMKGRKDQRKDPRAYLITPNCTWYLLQKCRSYRSNPGNWGRCLIQIHKTGPIWALGSSLFK